MVNKQKCHSVEWHLVKSFVLRFKGVSLKISVSWVVFSLDLDNSFLDLRFSLDNWIIDIVKVYTSRALYNLRLPNWLKKQLNKKMGG